MTRSRGLGRWKPSKCPTYGECETIASGLRWHDGVLTYPPDGSEKAAHRFQQFGSRLWLCPRLAGRGLCSFPASLRLAGAGSQPTSDFCASPFFRIFPILQKNRHEQPDGPTGGGEKTQDRERRITEDSGTRFNPH